MTVDMSLVEGQQETAIEMLRRTLAGYFTLPEDAKFLDELMSFVNDQVVNDTPAELIKLEIRNTNAWKTRFAGNEALKKAGLAELDVSTYLALERQYSAVLGKNGMNTLNTRSRFAELIGNNVSPAELEDRITNVYDRILNADDALSKELQSLRDQYGLSNADLAESLLMGKEGTKVLERKIATAEISSEANRRNITTEIGAEELVRRGVTREEAARGFETIRNIQPQLQSLANIYKESGTGLQKELEEEQFGGMLSQRRRRLTQRETQTFQGSSGVSTGSLAKSLSGNI